MSLARHFPVHHKEHTAGEHSCPNHKYRWRDRIGWVVVRLWCLFVSVERVKVTDHPICAEVSLTGVVTNLLFWSLGVTVARLCLVWVNTRAEERHDVLVTFVPDLLYSTELSVLAVKYPLRGEDPGQFHACVVRRVVWVQGVGTHPTLETLRHGGVD